MYTVSSSLLSQESADVSHEFQHSFLAFPKNRKIHESSQAGVVKSKEAHKVDAHQGGFHHLQLNIQDDAVTMQQFTSASVALRKMTLRNSQ